MVRILFSLGFPFVDIRAAAKYGLGILYLLVKFFFSFLRVAVTASGE